MNGQVVMGGETVGPATSAAAFKDERLPIKLPVWSSEDLARRLEEYRPYLLAIAIEELPAALRGKLGASDLVQDTMTRGVEHAGAFRGATTEELAGWLRSTLLNLLANVVKHYQTEKRDLARERGAGCRDVQAEQISPSTEALSREQWDLLQLALGRLSDEYRLAITLRHRENLTFAEIGDHIGKSEEAARKIWSRAIKQLQQEMRQHAAQRS